MQYKLLESHSIDVGGKKEKGEEEEEEETEEGEEEEEEKKEIVARARRTIMRKKNRIKWKKRSYRKTVEKGRSGERKWREYEETTKSGASKTKVLVCCRIVKRKMKRGEESNI